MLFYFLLSNCIIRLPMMIAIVIASYNDINLLLIFAFVIKYFCLSYVYITFWLQTLNIVNVNSALQAVLVLMHYIS